MSEDSLALAALTRFYRDVMLPDFERVIEKAFERFGQHMRSGYHRVLARLDRILMTGITIDLDSMERQLSSRRAPLGDLFELADRLYQHLERLDGGLHDIAGSEQEFALRSEVRGLRATRSPPAPTATRETRGTRRAPCAPPPDRGPARQP